MKRRSAFTAILALFAYCSGYAQQYFYDDFETYTVGNYLGLQSNQWITWSSSGGTSDDVYVANSDANSGSKSIYFYSANGNGPHDVVLDFGGVHNSGKFKYRAMYKIPNNAYSYFNFQGGAGIGQQWSFDFYFFSGGTWTSYGGQTANGTFPTNQWFELLIDVNFDTDTWNIYIDGNLQASITNTNPISYLDLYEVYSSSEWWMDDVSFCVNNGCNPELKLDNLTINPSQVCTHHEADLSVRVTNNSNFPAESFLLGVDVGNSQLSQTINLNDLGPGLDTVLILPGFFTSPIAGNAIQVMATNLSGDIDPVNDTTSTYIDVLPSPANTSIIPGTPYQSSRMNTVGNQGDPDIVTGAETLTYEIVPPTGYNNADYGSTWNITNLTVMTSGATTVSNSFYTFNAPSGGANATFSFTPDASLIDSSIWYSFSVNDLGNACDSVLRRYIQVVPRPVADFTQLDVCDKESMSFTNASSIQSGTMTYEWHFGDGSSSMLTNPTHKYATFGAYDVTLYATSDYGYVDSVTYTVDVFQLPTADFTVSNACEGDNVNFADQSFIPSGTPSFDWDFGDGSAAGSGASVGYTYAAAGTYSVTKTVTVNGCSDSKTRYATQAPRAVPSFSSQTACNNSVADFSNTSTLAFGSFGTHWKFGDGKEAYNNGSIKHDYAGFGTFDVTLIITTDLGCVDSTTASVSLTDAPDADFALSNACSEELITLNNLSNIPASGTNSYTWTLPGGAMSTDVNPTFTFPASGTYTIKLVAFNTNGCVDSISRNVMIDTRPHADFVAKDVCDGELVNFYNNTVNVPNGGSYFWDFGNGANKSGKADTSFSYAAAGDYTVSLIVATMNGCVDTASKLVKVNAIPDASFTVASGEKGDGTMVFTANASGNVSYFWNMGDGNKYTTQNVAHTYMALGNYQVKLTVTSDAGCSDNSTEIAMVNPNSVSLIENALVIYPNPNKGAFKVQMEGVEEIESMEIINMLGQMMGVEWEQTSPNELTVKVDAISSGTYVVRLTAKNKVYQQKIKIQ
ncbi:MAG: PKD domain-containing protein [Bacteroidota bacterium]|nr:PKD domain-containing protein [Bacteroidota bacterium]MDX5431731.1 PKD domain-containing protein [Bacteroidota bacterium]MDX5470446.1 PKD domain-containing protein [Bacteroidota bacterium]